MTTQMTAQLLVPVKRRGKRHRWTWHATGAVFGLVGSILFPLFGGLLWALENRLASVHPLLEDFALGLTFALVPLLVFGLYCLNIAVEEAVLVKSSLSRRRIPESGLRRW